MEQPLEILARQRAQGRCEYCRFPLPPFHVEHIIARKHGGATVESNLAFAWVRCNFHKGPNLSGIDSETGEVTRLFDPRRQTWPDHFGWRGSFVLGLTPVGRATIAVLQMNHPLRVEARQRLIADGVLTTE